MSSRLGFGTSGQELVRDGHQITMIEIAPRSRGRIQGYENGRVRDRVMMPPFPSPSPPLLPPPSIADAKRETQRGAGCKESRNRLNCTAQSQY